jgi:drug/metabolite transporter (DMT)-like permease
MRPPVPGPLVLCLLAALLFGASTPAAKRLLDEFGPITLAGLLYLGGALGIAPFARGGGEAALRRRPRELRLLAGAVVLGGVLGPVLLLAGLVRAPAGTTSLWLLLETVATTLLAAALYREHVGARAWIALGVILAGGMVLAAPSGAAFAPGSLPALGLVALACVCWGFDNNWTAMIGGFTPAQTTLVKAAVAGGVNLGIGLAVEGPRPGGTGAIAAALALGALAYGASIALYVRGAQQLGAIRSQLAFSTAPFLGLVLSWIVLGEPVLAVQVAAGIAMAAGVLLLSASRHEHEHLHEALEHTHAHRHDDGHHDHAHPGLPAHVEHTHAHAHSRIRHSHPHAPDLHHRHDHRVHSGG